MYKKVLWAVLPVFAFIVLLPQSSEAAQFKLQIPHGAIGVTEESYNAFVQKQRCDMRLPATDIAGGACSETIRTLNGKVIVRVQGKGEMYRFELVKGSGEPGVLDIQMLPYLPDGFYWSDKKLYWVAYGSKTRLKKGTAYHTFHKRITRDWMSRLPISEQMYSAINTKCESNGGDTIPSAECVKKEQYGKDLIHKFAGKILMRVEANGSLYHVLPDGSAVFNVGSKNNIGVDGATRLTFYKYAKLHSIGISPELMNTIP